MVEELLEQSLGDRYTEEELVAISFVVGEIIDRPNLLAAAIVGATDEMEEEEGLTRFMAAIMMIKGWEQLFVRPVSEEEKAREQFRKDTAGEPENGEA